MTSPKKAKIQLFRRILVSYNDFKQFTDIANHALNSNLHCGYPEKGRHQVRCSRQSSRVIGFLRKHCAVTSCGPQMLQTRCEASVEDAAALCSELSSDRRITTRTD